MRNVVLLTGPRLNCGDFLIADRARRLFTRFMPGITMVELNRLRPYGTEEMRRMEQADLFVLAGGPLIRDKCAADVNLAPLVESGWLSHVRTPFVVMGGGAKLKEPFVPGVLKPTPATRALFNKLETGPYFSGTRDFESLALLRNAGYTNFRFTGCPALFAPLEDRLPERRTFDLQGLERVVFSTGAPGGLSDGAIRQHVSIVTTLMQLLPNACLTSAFHHPVDASAKTRSLARQLESSGCEVVDVSGGLDGMEKLYRAADLHVGYRVHAHVLMTSWRKPSILIAEDGRASAMADVIGGHVVRAWHYASRRLLPIPARLCPPVLNRKVRTFDADAAARVGGVVAELLARRVVPNRVKVPVESAMGAWFGQFQGR